MFKHRSLLSLALASVLSLSLRADIAPSAAEARPLPVGALLPSATVATLDGNEVDLAKVASEKPTAIIFYRGGWCPYCNKHLAALAALEPELLALGFQIIALSPDGPAGLKATVGKNHLNYRLFSDQAMNAASAFGLAFRVDAATVEKYQKWNINLALVPGETDARWLPVPAVILVGPDGRVKYVYANEDYKTRLPDAELLAAAKAAL